MYTETIYLMSVYTTANNFNTSTAQNSKLIIETGHNETRLDVELLKRKLDVQPDNTTFNILPNGISRIFN